MLAQVTSGALIGIDAHAVQVEVNTDSYGDPKLHIVGLPDAAVKESDDRVRAAVFNSGFTPHDCHVTVNLAPGSIRKEGPIYDLPIALGLLAATEQLAQGLLDGWLIAGELSLGGTLRPVRGGLALAMLARQQGKRGVLLPALTAEEAALVEDVAVYPVNTLQEAVNFLTGLIDIPRMRAADSPFRRPPSAEHRIDFAEVKGQHHVRRAVEVAVAGGHNLLMLGPPGSGKSMIAKRIPTIMPEPSLDEYLEILAIQSAAGMTLSRENSGFERPFRSPHHTISDVGLIGGGSKPQPGEISLAHNGVLFLDELPEFRRSTLEVLRQPLEDNIVTISRAAAKVTFPASVMLVTAMNPTPSGYTEKDGRETGASAAQIQRYRSRISGPLLDRIDIHVEAPALTFGELRSAQPGETSASIRERVNGARARQHARFASKVPVGVASGFNQDDGGDPQPDAAIPRTAFCNARMNHRQIREFCQLGQGLGDVLQGAMEQLKLSARAYDRILKVSRTIADLENSETICQEHLMEAIQYRTLDRNVFY